MQSQTYHGSRKGGKARLAPSVLGAAAAVAAVAVWLRIRPFRVVVAGDSMAPALLPGDCLVATRTGRVVAGVVVVAEDPRTPGFEVVKRVTAGPNRPGGWTTLGTDELWLQGDSPDRSSDSRTFGPVRRSAIRGVVRLRYWPPSRVGPVAGRA